MEHNRSATSQVRSVEEPTVELENSIIAGNSATPRQWKGVGGGSRRSHDGLYAGVAMLRRL